MVDLGGVAGVKISVKRRIGDVASGTTTAAAPVAAAVAAVFLTSGFAMGGRGGTCGCWPVSTRCRM